MSEALRVCALAVAFAATTSTFAGACSSSDDEASPPGSDAGDGAASDGGDSGTTNDAGRDAFVLVDASAPPVACSVTPCAVEIASGADSVCVRLDNGTVQCWGSNGGGELGRGEGGGASNSPAPVADLTDATQLSGSVSAPGDVYCALRASGVSVCWGSNENGTLGRTLDDAVDTESSPVVAPVAGVGAATAVYAGSAVSCALLAGNDVACWGTNSGGQIPGQPRDTVPLPATTFALASPSKVLGVSDRGTVALTDTGLISWGLSGRLLGVDTGVLGRESSPEVSGPGSVRLPFVSAIAASTGRVCAIANGQVYCWGAGPVTGSDSVYPTPAGVGSFSTPAVTIAVGPRSACATLADGVVRCWGDNSRGQLGGGNAALQPLPVTVQNLERAVRVATMDATTCAILSTGAVQCWGQNDKGQLGTGTADALPHLEPQNVVLAP